MPTYPALCSQGIESILLSNSTNFVDTGIAIHTTQNTAEELSQTLQRNEACNRPVRVIRVVHDETRSANSDGQSSDRSVMYRYDGLYSPCADQTAGASDKEVAGKKAFTLHRVLGQPELISDRIPEKKLQKTGAVTNDHDIPPLEMLMAVEVYVPQFQSSTSAAALVGAQHLPIEEALSKLYHARAQLIKQLNTKGRYMLIRRQLLRELRVRSAVELLHACEPS